MHSFFASVLAAASITAATASQGDASQIPDLSKIPPCALQCLTTSAGQSGCQLTDLHCQCTTGAAAIAKAIVPCLCASTCSPQELMGTLSGVGELCITALAAKGENFKIPDINPSMCSAGGASGGATGGATGGASEGSSGSSTPPPASSSLSTPPSASSPETPPAYPATGYAPHTNMTPNAMSPTSPSGYNNSTTPSIVPSPGAASGMQHNTMGTAALVGLIGIVLAAI